QEIIQHNLVRDLSGVADWVLEKEQKQLPARDDLVLGLFRILPPTKVEACTDWQPHSPSASTFPLVHCILSHTATGPLPKTIRLPQLVQPDFIAITGNCNVARMLLKKLRVVQLFMNAVAS